MMPTLPLSGGWRSCNCRNMSVDLSILPVAIRPTAEDLTKKFEFKKAISKGSNGHVLVGTNRLTDQKIVVKFYYWGDGAHLEPKRLCQLNSPHILNVLDAAAINENDAYFVTPYCEHGDLEEHIEKGCGGIRRALEIILDVATGANEIHSAGFIHRDLKPSNIFCNADNKFVIGDFGSVVEQNEHGYAETNSKHSLLYRTPEEAASGRAYPQGDVYQIGMMFFQLLGGCLPYTETAWLTSKELAIYDAKSHPDDQLYANWVIEMRIRSGKILDYYSLPKWVPQELIRVVRKCCKLNHLDRYSSPSELIVKLNNLRSFIPDWRFDPDPVLHTGKCQFRIAKSGEKYLIEKKAGEHSAWRKQNKYQATSYAEAIEFLKTV